jgi:hypothetical protein
VSHCADHGVGPSAIHEGAGDLTAQFARPDPIEMLWSIIGRKVVTAKDEMFAEFERVWN